MSIHQNVSVGDSVKIHPETLSEPIWGKVIHITPKRVQVHIEEAKCVTPFPKTSIIEVRKPDEKNHE